MKNENFKTALLLFGIMGGLSIILCFVLGNKAPIIEFISAIILICFPPILYLSGIIRLVYSMIVKETNIIASIIAGVLATVIFLFFYGLATVVILIG